MLQESASLEPQKDNAYDQAAAKIAHELLESGSYAKLSEADLRSKGLIAKEESLFDYFYREMKFGESLQDIALLMFCNEAPPPIDTTEVNQWRNKEIFPRGREDELRLRYLGVLGGG